MGHWSCMLVLIDMDMNDALVKEEVVPDISHIRKERETFR